MDPTERLIDLMSALERLEEAHIDNNEPDGEEAQAARADAISALGDLQEWLEELNGSPPLVSEVVLTKKPKAAGG